MLPTVLAPLMLYPKSFVKDSFDDDVADQLGEWELLVRPIRVGGGGGCCRGPRLAKV